MLFSPLARLFQRSMTTAAKAAKKKDIAKTKSAIAKLKAEQRGDSL